jgi:hypothetical protein
MRSGNGPGRPVRRFRVSVVGQTYPETGDKAPKAVEHVRRLLEQIFERYGVQLAVSGVEPLGPLD